MIGVNSEVWDVVEVIAEFLTHSLFECKKL